MNLASPMCGKDFKKLNWLISCAVPNRIAFTGCNKQTLIENNYV